MYRLEGVGHATGTCALLLCHWWLIMLSWQGEGRRRGIKRKHKGPLLFMGVTQSWSSSLVVWRAECRLSQQVHMCCLTMVFTPKRQQITCRLVKMGGGGTSATTKHKNTVFCSINTSEPREEQRWAQLKSLSSHSKGKSALFNNKIKGRIGENHCRDGWKDTGQKQSSALYPPINKNSNR